MRLSRRAKLGLDPKVQLNGSALEPRSAPGDETRRFWNLGQAKELTVELASQRFTTGGHRQLHVIDSVDVHGEYSLDARL